jgi:hypothetical protein
MVAVNDGKDYKQNLGSLTVGILLELSELFWREFTLSFTHFSGGGGRRVWKPLAAQPKANIHSLVTLHAL